MPMLRLADGRRIALRSSHEPHAASTHVMAILNATPDSFSDGGTMPAGAALDKHILRLAEDGATIFDVGGESTRPGHERVGAEEETRRVVPVLHAIRRVAPDAIVSIDTRKAAVAKAAMAAGASFINDVSGLGDPGMAAVAHQAGCSLVLMRNASVAGDLVPGVRAQLADLVDRAIAAGLPREALVLDPGLGFGDPPGADVQANLALVRRVADYDLGHPVLIGASRKRFIGTMTGVAEPSQRVAGSVAVAVEAARAGAAIVRVHDVAATRVGLQAAGF